MLQTTSPCAACQRPLKLAEAVGLDEMVFHERCAPQCGACGRRMHTGDEELWLLDAQVVDVKYGYSLQPIASWCPECWDSAPHDEPAALD